MRHHTAAVTRLPATRPELRRSPEKIDWHNARSHAIDGFTVGDIAQMIERCLIPARCNACNEERRVQPDARGFDCLSCGSAGSVTSPLVKLGFI